MTIYSGRAALATMLSVAAPVALAHGQQPSPRQPRPSAVSPAPPGPAQTPRPSASVPQGFSVVLVLGDLQGAAAADDVPPAARKALSDMRDFLPFKSYRLLDAAWLLCCGYESARGAAEGRRSSGQNAADSVSQVLRGPDEQEYELRLSTSRAENSRVFVRFSLEAGSEPDRTVAAVAETQLIRQLADYQDKRNYLEIQLKELRAKVDVGIAPGAEVGKLELELRSIQRRIQELETRLAGGSARGSRSSLAQGARQKIIDTSFTMDVGETVVVGTSRLKGGTRALIALLTAVPPRAGGKE